MFCGGCWHGGRRPRFVEGKGAFVWQSVLRTLWLAGGLDGGFDWMAG